MYTIAVIIVLYFYVRLGIWVAKKATANSTSASAKWAIRTAIALVLFLIPFGDEITGRIYFNHLCETEARVKVYQTIELPAEYWDKDGSPTFYDPKNGNLKMPVSDVKWQSLTEKLPLHVEKDVSILMRTKANEKINERVLFSYWGGWLRRNMGLHNTANSCGASVSSYTNYINKTFVAMPAISKE